MFVFFKNVRVCIFSINFPEKHNIVNRAWPCGRYLCGWQMYTAHKKNKGIFQNNSNESMLCMKRILKYTYMRSSFMYFFSSIRGRFEMFCWNRGFPSRYSFSIYLIWLWKSSLVDGIILIYTQYDFCSPLQDCIAVLLWTTATSCLKLLSQKRNKTRHQINNGKTQQKSPIVKRIVAT